MNPPKISAITLDLDDTLWPVWPAIERAEHHLHAWLREHAPEMAAALDAAGLRRLRDEVARERPEWAHDLSAIRLESLRRGLVQHGHSADLAEPAFEIFLAARQRVDFYPDARPAIQRLASRFKLLALTNGNADLGRLGLSHWFAGIVSARQAGIGKPHPYIFMRACTALRLPAKQVLHVGDDLDTDVAGALSSGMHAAWVCRHRSAHAHRPKPDGVHKVADLHALASWLGC